MGMPPVLSWELALRASKTSMTSEKLIWCLSTGASEQQKCRPESGWIGVGGFIEHVQITLA